MYSSGWDILHILECIYLEASFTCISFLTLVKFFNPYLQDVNFKMLLDSRHPIATRTSQTVKIGKFEDIYQVG